MENFSTQLVSALFALALVILLAWFFLRALRRFQYGKSEGDELRFQRALPVGTRERIVIIEYRGQEYLLGVTPGGINLLEKLPKHSDTANRTQVETGGDKQ